MSIPFTSLGPEDSDKAGYFRIGHIVLKTPPTDILTNRVSGKERVTVLRGSNDLVKLTGKGRWDVTVRWIAMLDDTAAETDLVGRYAQWEDLRSIVAIFKVAPFVEIENAYVRQVLCEQDPTASSSMRMAFGLRQLRISTHPDIVDALDCSLTMTWFNYFPYSSDFAYNVTTDGGVDIPGDAIYSDKFAAYINSWKANNLDASYDQFYDGLPIVDYKKQLPGVLKLNWREYRTVKIDTAVIVNGADLSRVPGAASEAHVSASALQIALAAVPIAQSVGKKINVPPQIVYAEWCHETGGFKNRGARQLNNLAGINVPGGRGQDYRAFSTLTDFGNYYASLITRRYRSVVGTTTIASFASGLKAGGYFTASLSEYINGMNSFRNTYFDYVAKAGKIAPVQTPPKLMNAAIVKPAATPLQPDAKVKSLSGGTALDKLLASLTPDERDQIQDMLDNEWQLDFNTNDLAYFYITHEAELADDDHKSQDVQDAIVMPPRQLSILMVNNLAQIPLASYQYPTYQHVGSSSSAVSIGFLSVGEWSTEDTEPVHIGISLLGGLISFLEVQYLSYRNNVRRVETIHRFNAVMADNQILNMLGIRGLTLDNLSTETVPDASDLVQVELSAKQYENVFESVDSYKIRTVEDAALNVTRDLIDSGALSSLAESEQKVLPNLVAFAKARSNYDLTALCPYLLKIGSMPNNNLFKIFDNTDVINVPADWGIKMLAIIMTNKNSETKTTNVLQSVATGLAGAPVLGDVAQALANKSYSTAIKNYTAYPNIAVRMDWVNSSGQWKAGDVALITALASKDIDSAVPSDPVGVAWDISRREIGASNKERIQAIYDDVFTILGGTDSAFSLEANTLADSPTFADKYLTAFDVRGPALSASNTRKGYSDHTAYKDMGLRTLSIKEDNNPGSYFVNHSAEYETIVRGIIGDVVTASKATSDQVNTATPGVKSEFYTGITNSEYVGSNADADSLVKMVNIPGLSMAEAYPTFKMFLMEDEAGGLINCYDNFYSYASVTELEVARYQDKPDVAVIQITNVANLLMHHLYDATLMGRYTSSLRPWEGQALPGGGSTGDNPNSAVHEVGRTVAGQLYQDLSDGMHPAQRERIPLQYVALQAGTKIQIRMGYANNPDKLTPIFTGRVTQINTEDDMLIITAESFLGELCTIPTYSGKPSKDRDFGEEYSSNDSGDTASMVEYLLKADQAKHFGAFKLAAQSDPLFTGLTWENRLGRVVGEFSVGSNNLLTEIGAALFSSYDRSGENILINHVINYQGSPTAIRNGSTIATRHFEDDSSSNLYLKFSYHIKKEATFTSWDLIRDVSRRYPEYILACKQYAFPFSADATMVLAHPLDWYYARPPMIGDVERYHTSLTRDADWKDWWQAQGKGLWDIMVHKIAIDLGQSDAYTRSRLTGFKGGLFSGVGNEPTGPGDMEDRMQSLLQSMRSFFGVDAGSTNPGLIQSLGYGIDVGIEKLLNSIISIPNILFGGANLNALDKKRFADVLGEMRDLERAWMLWMQRKNPQATDRLKPVRRYHFIDHNTIVHNGMVVNDRIYNGIKVREDVTMANEHIPSHYRRILDVTSLMNDPEQNLPTQPIRTAVAQSFLREEVGKMYDGEIVLRGTPEIEPYDCLVILDPSTAITGTVEVGKVIHSFSQETGYITIVTPRCLVAVNESASAGIARMFTMIMAKAAYTGSGLSPNGGFGQTWKSMDSTQKGISVASVGTAVGGTAAFVALVGTPPGWVVAILGGVCLFGGILVTGFKNHTANSIQVMPVSRWGRPWVGGLEGYQIADMFQNLGSEFKAWEADNIYPLIDTYRNIIGAQTDTVPAQGAPPAVSAGSTPALNPPVK